METRGRRSSAASVAAAAALLAALLLATAAPCGAAACHSTITIYSGPGCRGENATFECGNHQIPVHGGFRFHYSEGFPVVILRFFGDSPVLPITTRYARDVKKCNIPDSHYAQMSC